MSQQYLFVYNKSFVDVEFDCTKMSTTRNYNNFNEK